MLLARFDWADQFICFCKILHILVISCSHDDARCILSCNILLSQSKHGNICKIFPRIFTREALLFVSSARAFGAGNEAIREP